MSEPTFTECRWCHAALYADAFYDHAHWHWYHNLHGAGCTVHKHHMEWETPKCDCGLREVIDAGSHD